MGKPEVIFKYDVLVYLSKLSVRLLKKKIYFSYVESADKYVDFIYDQITENIHYKKHNSTLPQHKKYGDFYIVITTNNRTAWHVFFNKKDNRYMVNKILNNHLPSAKFLNSL